MVGRIVQRLKEHELIAEVRGDKVGLIPARASTAIRLDDVLEAFRATDLQIARGALSPNLAAAAPRPGGDPPEADRRA